MNTDDASLLESGETVAAEFRRHWIAPVRSAVLIAILGAAPFFVWFIFVAAFDAPHAPFASRILFFAGVAWIFGLWVALFVRWTEYWLARWYVTDRRVLGVGQRGLFVREAASIALSKVAAATARTDGLAQSLLHFGDVAIEGDAGEYILARDIPHPETLQKALQEATMHTGELREANERQRRTLTLVAHEVKGYLAKNAAVFASIAEGDFGAAPAPLKGVADTALSDTRAGVGAMMDILDSAAAGSGAALRAEPFDLKAEVRAIVLRERPTAAAKGLALDAVEDPQPCMVTGDREKLRERVVRNLIDNAVVYTPRGRVTVGVTRIEGNIAFWVEDTGIGILPEDMDKLFTEGGHGTDSRAINPHSTGFGLFAAKQVVEAHGGRIWAESEGREHGSRFYVVLPGLARAPESR